MVVSSWLVNQMFAKVILIFATFVVNHWQKLTTSLILMEVLLEINVWMAKFKKRKSKMVIPQKKKKKKRICFLVFICQDNIGSRCLLKDCQALINCLREWWMVGIRYFRGDLLWDLKENMIEEEKKEEEEEVDEEEE